MTIKKMLTAKEVKQRVDLIRKHSGDDESAHSEEDALYRDVLEAIAEGHCEDGPACARIALTTQFIAFQRWCA